MIHELKILPAYFTAVVDMTKPFEVRREDDKIFIVGDELLLKEYDGKNYTGSICHRIVTYRLPLVDDLVVLGLGRK